LFILVDRDRWVGFPGLVVLGNGGTAKEIFTNHSLFQYSSLEHQKGILLRILLICCLLAVTHAKAYGDLLQLASGAEMTVRFSIPNWSSTNSAAEIPALIELQLMGPTPTGSTLASIPGSTSEYYSGILLKGWIQSLDGKVSSPLFDANAARLGLSQGSLVAEALYGAGTMIDGEAYLSQNLAESLFGTSGQAVFLIQNLGKNVTIGLGDGYGLSNAVLTPITSASYQQTSGSNQQLQVSSAVPEPALWGAVAASLVLFFAMRRRPSLALIRARIRSRQN
jgi:hypothetical protein